MFKWLLRILAIAFLVFVGYGIFDLQRGGFFNLPELPEDAYSISFKNGFRAIIIDTEVSEPDVASYPIPLRRLTSANPDRKYLGLPFEVQPWFEDAWSWCEAPTDEDRAQFATFPEETRRHFENARFEGVCRIDVDGDLIARGFLFSVPRL